MKPARPSNKVVLVTGGNSGIGEVTVTELAKQGFRVYVACRPSVKTLSALARIKVQSRSDEVFFIPLDLADFDSVRACAAEFLAKEKVLDRLINNAGLAGHKGLTASGFEMTFGVCHMGHFLLTKLLMGALEKADEARVITVASMAHRHIKSIDFEKLRLPTKSPFGLLEYGVAKAANILFTKSLARQLAATNISSYCLHPGVVATDVWRKMPGVLQPLIKRFMVTAAKGAETSLYLATAPLSSLSNGGYYINSRLEASSDLSENEAVANSLWQKSENWIE